MEQKRQLVKSEELYELARKLVKGWKKIALFAGVAFVLGVVVAFSSIKRYTSEVSMAPELNGASGLGGLGALASMAGVNLGSMGENADAIYPYLYPDVVCSLPFMTDLLDVRVQNMSGSVDTTYLYYRKNVERKSWMDVVVEFPKKSLRTVMGLFVKKESWGINEEVFNPYNLSEKQLNFMQKFRSDMGINIDKKTDVISLCFTAQDPKVAAMMADAMRLKLQDAITEYRTQKAALDLDYCQELYSKAKVDYEEAQLLYADYCDKNRSVSSERFLVEKNRLETDKDLKFTIFTQWAQQLQVAQAKLQQNTPAFTVLKPAAIPALPSSARKVKILVIFMFLGIMAGSAWILTKETLAHIWDKVFRA